MTQTDWTKIIIDTQNGVRLNVKITPGSSRTKILGPHGDCLKIAVAAPPEKGKANHALIEFLAKTLNLPKQNITVHAGHTAPRKTLLLQGTTAASCATLFNL